MRLTDTVDWLRPPPAEDCQKLWMRPSSGVLDDLSSLERLERSFRATKKIEELYRQPHLSEIERALAPLESPMHAVEHIGNQFSLYLLDAYLEEEPTEAFRRFKQIEPHTTDQELALLVNQQQFDHFHADLHVFLEEIGPSISDSVKKNHDQIRREDLRQFQTDERETLESCLRSGLTVRVLEEHRELLEEAKKRAGFGVLPVTEYLKNERCIQVNRFKGSKVSQVVHDALDHIWLFDLLQKERHDIGSGKPLKSLLKKFDDFFRSVGSPAETDLFKREGELAASIGFGVRYWSTVPTGFSPIISTEDIANHMEGLLQGRFLESRHFDALSIVLGLRSSPLTREAQSLGYVFSNYLVELNEQRRKFGTIKVMDLATKQVQGELNPWSADFISFFIESHHLILQSKTKHRDQILRLHLLLEHFLSSEKALNGEELLITFPIEGPDSGFQKAGIPPERISWMNSNYGFTANRDRVH